MLIGKLLKGVMGCQTFLPCKYNRNAQEGNSNKYYMNLLSKVGRIIISVIGFLIVWVFLPVFGIIGLYCHITGKVSRELEVGRIDARFLERLEFKLDENEWEVVKGIAERLKTKGYKNY